MYQYFFPTITYRYIMYFFRTFKKSTVPYKVYNMGLRYINKIKLFITEEDMPIGPLRPTFSDFGFATGLNQSKMTLYGQTMRLVSSHDHFGRHTDCFGHFSCKVLLTYTPFKKR
jgi:hypothetical protein